MTTATPEQLLALLDAPHWKLPGSTSRKTEGPTARRTEGQAAVNLTVVDHVAEGRQVLARAAKLTAEGTTLAQREAAALRAAQAMKSEALIGAAERVRQHACPACGCWTLLPRKGHAWCINRHCAPAPGRARRWAFHELAFIGPGRPKAVQRTTGGMPRDVMDLRRLVVFFAQSGRPVSDSTLRRLITTHGLSRWPSPSDPRGYGYALSDVATAHALHVASKDRGDCTASRERPPCTGLADLFHAERPTADQTELAKGLCGGCPLKEVCLETALEQPGCDQHGIYGGLTAAERRALKPRT